MNTRKIVIEFSADLLKRVKQATPNLPTEFIRKNGGLNFSKFVRKATEWYICRQEKEKVDRELVEGYRANSTLDRQICAEFDSVLSDGM